MNAAAPPQEVVGGVGRDTIEPGRYLQGVFSARKSVECFEESILSQDNLKVGFELSVTWRIRPSQVRDFVERFTTLGLGAAGRAAA